MVWFRVTVERFTQDLRYAVRTMASNRTFTLLATLSLALGIGANTAIYSFMESILLRSLPVREPESLVVMKWRAKDFPGGGISMSTGGTYSNPQGGVVGSVFPYPALELFRNNSGILASAFCYFGAGRLNVTIRGESEAVETQYVSGEYFSGMGVPPAAGRLIVAADDQAVAAPVAVLDYGYSQRRFGEAGSAVGQSIQINDKPFTIVGIAPPEFFGAEPGVVPAVYVPMRANLLLQPPLVGKTVEEQYLDRNFYWIEIMGRLKPHVSLAQAQISLGLQFRHFVEESASKQEQLADVPELTLLEGSGGLDSLRRKYSMPLYILMGAAGLILLIACTNIANLLLLRATARRREIALRLSVGASRLRIVQQLLTESVLLASMGGGLGLVFAFWAIRFLTLTLGIGRDGFTLHAGLNLNVLSVTVALSILTGVLFGLAPAIHATRADVMRALKDDRTMISFRSIRPTLIRLSHARILVATQMALLLLLLLAAGLFTRTLANLRSIELGFDRENVLLFSINPQAVGYERLTLNRLYVELRERLSHIPGVRSVSLSNRPLLSGSGTLVPVSIPGATEPAVGQAVAPPKRAGLFRVGPAFFKTMRIPLIAGREFDERDEAGASRVAVINQRLARVFGLDNAVGRKLSLGNSAYEIVGVVGDALFLSLKEAPQPMLYLPLLSAQPPGTVTYEVLTTGDPLNYVTAIRQMVGQMDSRLAVSDLKTQAAHIDQTISQEIAFSRVCTLFAALALMIACVGMYGTVALNVARRTNEIGVRMALGAQPNSIIWLVFREIFALGLVGVAIGVPLALVGSRFVQSFLFGIKPNDPLTILIAVLVLFAAAFVASYVPAWRASRIDPMVALRHE
ncbi:MAG: ABC transporter permease [Blastocatellia bacterium]